jgi:predicted nucleotidyltransferase component of viral defense system
LPLVFKGGTYLWFFHGLRRFSEDLDFTASEESSKDIPEMVSRSLALFGVVNELKRIKDNNTTFSFRITANGPLNSGLRDRCVVYVEISKREMVLCKTIPVKFDRPEYQLPIKNLSGMALEEVGAEKVRAIMTRDKARDIYDLYYLIHNKKIKIDNKLTVQKLKYYKTGFSKLKLIEKINDSNDYYKKELTTIVLEDIPDYKFVRTTIDDWIL